MKDKLNENGSIETRLESIEQLLRSQNLNNKIVLSIDDLALYTGLSKLYIYKLTSQNKIPFYKSNGKIIRFKKEEIDTWLLRNRQSTEQEIQEKAITESTLKF